MLWRALRGVSSAALLAAASGCASDAGPSAPTSQTHIGGQTGGEAGIACSNDIEVTGLAFDADSPLGFSAADVASSLPGAISVPLAWSDGTTSTLELELAYGTAGYASRCRANALNVTLSLTSGDGALAETVDARLFATSVDRGSISAAVDAATLAGTLLATHPALAVTGDKLVFHVSFDAASASGDVMSDGTPSDELATF